MSAAGVHRDSVVVDLHVHAPHFVPGLVGSVWQAIPPGKPRQAGFDSLRAGGVDAVVAKAVGDPIVTRWYRGLTPWAAVDRQLNQIEAEAAGAGVIVVTTAAEIAEACRSSTPAVLLGVEGADALGDDVDSVDRWFERGVRAVVLVHLADNLLGTTCLPWQRYAGPLPVRRRRQAGLSAFGRAVMKRMQQLGMVVDLAHADRATLLGAVESAVGPVISSHSGARKVQDFPRYLADDELRAIASTGGVVGLWPYRHGRYGVATVDDLVTHARHIASVVGVDHVAIGTDMNGVPGQMRGYRDERDLPVVTAALLDAGFAVDEVAAIVGANALRVLTAAL